MMHNLGQIAWTTRTASIFQSLQGVNNTAERAVQMFSKVNRTLTKTEDGMQF